MKNSQLLEAIGVEGLIRYFEFLDNLRESGVTNMFGAGNYLMREYPGMLRHEAHTVLGAWMGSFTHTLPPEDRVMKVLEGDV